MPNVVQATWTLYSSKFSTHILKETLTSSHYLSKNLKSTMVAFFFNNVLLLPDMVKTYDTKSRARSSVTIQDKDYNAKLG